MRTKLWLSSAAMALTLLLTVFTSPAEACDKKSTTQISVQGNPMNACKEMRDFGMIELSFKVYYCVGEEFDCKSVDVNITLSNPDKDKTQKDLAKEIADAIKAAAPDFEGEVKATDNVVTMTGTNSCSGSGDPATPDDPDVYPPGSSKSSVHISQQTWMP